MKIKPRNLLTIAAAAAIVALFAAIGSNKTWRLWTSSSELSGHIVVTENREASPAALVPPTDEFDRVMIQNIATVPFVELFDLLRSAPAGMRSRWIKQLEEMPKGPQKAAALSSFYKIFVQLNPAAAAESIAGLHDKLDQSVAAAAMVKAAAPSAMGEMATMLIKLPSDISWGGNWGDVFYDWSAINPAAAAHFVEQHPDVSENFALTSILLSNWAQADPSAAREWLERQPESIQTEDAIAGMLEGWFEHDEASAAAFAAAHGGAKNFRRALNGLAWSLFSSSPDKARVFLLGLPGEARNNAVDEIATLTNGSILGGSENWRRPPEDVARWILTLPQESWKGAMPTVLENWNRQDEAGLSTWLDQFPPDTRDQLVADFCSSGNHEHPDRSLSLALTITDSALRAQTLDGYMCHWLALPRKDVLATINGTALSPEQKKYLINLLPSE